MILAVARWLITAVWLASGVAIIVLGFRVGGVPAATKLVVLASGLCVILCWFLPKRTEFGNNDDAGYD